MAINDNSLDLSAYRGEVKPCPLCAAQTPGAKLDAMTSGKTCKMCLGHSFIAVCLNCDGTGSYKGRTVWDGGRSEHASTCTPCGGKGAFPCRKPATWKGPQSAVESEPLTV